jgi:predicted PurR-regulated permease PerM
MPVPPLLEDLAGWGWRLLLLAFIAWLLLRVAQQLYLVSLPIAASLLMTALLSPVVTAGTVAPGSPRRPGTTP